MEAEALTTDTCGMQTAPDEERDMPDTNDNNPAQGNGDDQQADSEPSAMTFRDLGVAEPICAAL
jgi:hypothetical protein